MGYRHSRPEILSAAVDTALDQGVARLTFATVAKRLSISDRMVVYYFPSKSALVTSVAETLAAGLVDLLDAAFGSDPATPDELTRRAWDLLTTPDADRVFALYFQVVGLAAAGDDLYRALARQLVESWVAWLVPRVTGATDAERRANAIATVAQVDGLLLARQVLGPDARQAALGVVRNRP
jgi:AcrR family transcriptional regulator